MLEHGHEFLKAGRGLNGLTIIAGPGMVTGTEIKDGA